MTILDVFVMAHGYIKGAKKCCGYELFWCCLAKKSHLPKWLSKWSCW